jgi:hypothetical protein
MIHQNEADVAEMLTEPGKWLDGGTLLFKGTPGTHETSLGRAKRPSIRFEESFQSGALGYGIEGLTGVMKVF